MITVDREAPVPKFETRVIRITTVGDLHAFNDMLQRAAHWTDVHSAAYRIAQGLIRNPNLAE